MWFWFDRFRIAVIQPQWSLSASFLTNLCRLRLIWGGFDQFGWNIISLLGGYGSAYLAIVGFTWRLIDGWRPKTRAIKNWSPKVSWSFVWWTSAEFAGIDIIVRGSICMVIIWIAHTASPSVVGAKEVVDFHGCGAFCKGISMRTWQHRWPGQLVVFVWFHITVGRRWKLVAHEQARINSFWCARWVSGCDLVPRGCVGMNLEVLIVSVMVV